MTEMENVEF